MLKNLNIDICKSLFESTHLFKNYLLKIAAKYDRCISYYKLFVVLFFAVGFRAYL